VIVQTRLQEHAVIRAATRADPGLVSASEAPVRMELNLPPASALAEISGDADVTETVARQLGRQLGIEVMGPTAGTWLVRAADHRLLCDALAAAGRPPGADGSKLRIDVDPIRA
jgi:primosomal protein N'